MFTMYTTLMVMIASLSSQSWQHTHTKTEGGVIDRLSSFHSLEADIPIQ